MSKTKNMTKNMTVPGEFFWLTVDLVCAVKEPAKAPDVDVDAVADRLGRMAFDKIRRMEAREEFQADLAKYFEIVADGYDDPDDLEAARRFAYETALSFYRERKNALTARESADNPKL